MTPAPVHIHVGPHKTGSTSIQRFLALNAGALEAAHGLRLVSNAAVREAAMALSRGEEARFRRRFAEGFAEHADHPGALVLSKEDFAGGLPGRQGERTVYGRLRANLDCLAAAVAPRPARFLFVERPFDTWLESCYLQNLRFRTDFASFAAFRDAIEAETDWPEVTRAARAAHGAAFVPVGYVRDPRGLLSAVLDALGVAAPLEAFRLPRMRNQSRPELRAVLEAINAAPVRPRVKAAAKSVIWTGEVDRAR